MTAGTGKYAVIRHFEAPMRERFEVFNGTNNDRLTNQEFGSFEDALAWIRESGFTYREFEYQKKRGSR